MTDNVSLVASADPSTPASGTVIATDNIGGINYQRVKVTWGADGTATDAASGAGLPVAQDGSWSINAVQSGTWNVTNISGTISLPTGAATDASLTNGNQKTKLLDSGGTNLASISAAGAIKVDNSAVTQPVSGTVTAAQATAASLNATVVGTGTFAVQAAQSGTWNIATVTTLTGITNALPAGTNTIGKTFIAPQTTKQLTTASVSISSSGDNTVVAGTALQTIRIFKLVLVAASSVSVTLKDGASTSLTGAMPLAANGSLTVDAGDGEPEFVTSAGNAFIVNLGGAVTVTGWVQYTKS